MMLSTRAAEGMSADALSPLHTLLNNLLSVSLISGIIEQCMVRDYNSYLLVPANSHDTQVLTVLLPHMFNPDNHCATIHVHA